MDHDVSQRFRPFLAPNESVRWSGRPQQGLAFRTGDLFVVPFSLLWCGFAIFWESLAVASGVWFMMLWGVPFVLVGLYMVIGRFFYDAFTRSRTYYAITTTNALILGGFTGDKLTAVHLKTLAELHLKTGASGRGSIIFGPETGQVAGFSNRQGVVASPEFFGIEDVNTVYALVQKQRREN